MAPALDKRRGRGRRRGGQRVGAGERLYRARRIGTTFGRIYLGIKAQQWIERNLGPPDMKRRWSRFNRQSAESIYTTATELRGLILKGCQFLGARADVVPPEYAEALAALQDRVPPHPFEIAREVIESELGVTLETVFRSFDPLPVASASLAQVHVATLVSGERVAVKVQYPEIASLVHSDLGNLRALFTAVGLIEREVDLLPLIDELGDQVPKELDFVAEGRNAERIAKFFEGRRDVRIPEIHWPLTTPRVLVSEYIPGIKITDRVELDCAEVDRDALMKTLIEVYCEQILTHGFFHADPHPGNLMVLPADGDHPVQLVMLDFGLAKQLPPDFHQGAVRFAAALLQGEPKTMALALAEIGFETARDSDATLELISAILLDVARQLRHQSHVDPKVVRQAASELPRLIRENPMVRVPGHVVLLARVFGLLSGLGHSLDARVDMLRTILPFAAPRPTPGAGS